MGKFDDKANMTVINYEVISEAWVELRAIVGTLNKMHDKAITLAGDFAENYQGEAVDEVKIFLESLPIHIERLANLYDKMAAFVLKTTQSFQTNDTKMVENMEN